MSIVVHITGQPVVIQGRYCRQRCAWCGEILVDNDLSCIATSDPNGGYNPFWEANRALEVDTRPGGGIVRSSILETPDGLLPDHACTPAREQPAPPCGWFSCGNEPSHFLACKGAKLGPILGACRNERARASTERRAIITAVAATALS